MASRCSAWLSATRYASLRVHAHKCSRLRSELANTEHWQDDHGTPHLILEQYGSLACRMEHAVLGGGLLHEAWQEACHPSCCSALLTSCCTPHHA